VAPSGQVELKTLLLETLPSNEGATNRRNAPKKEKRQRRGTLGMCH